MLYKIDLPFEEVSDLYFHAFERDVYSKRDVQDQSLLDIPRYKAIWRRLSGDSNNGTYHFLGMVSLRYRIFQNSSIFKAIETVLSDLFSKDGMIDLTIQDDSEDHGAVSIRQYIIRSSIASVGERSKLMFRVVVTNTFDATGAFRCYAGDIDSFCTNGRISGEYIIERVRHDKSLDLKKLSQFIIEAHTRYLNGVVMANRLHAFTVTGSQANELLCHLNDTDRFKDNIGTILLANIEYHGRNLWAVVSTATWWASTQDAGWAVPSTPASIAVAPTRRLNRQHNVATWMRKHVYPLIKEHTDE